VIAAEGYVEDCDGQEAERLISLAINALDNPVNDS